MQNLLNKYVIFWGEGQESKSARAEPHKNEARWKPASEVFLAKEVCTIVESTYYAALLYCRSGIIKKSPLTIWSERRHTWFRLALIWKCKNNNTRPMRGSGEKMKEKLKPFPISPFPISHPWSCQSVLPAVHDWRVQWAGLSEQSFWNPPHHPAFQALSKFCKRKGWVQERWLELNLDTRSHHFPSLQAAISCSYVTRYRENPLSAALLAVLLVVLVSSG